MGKGLLIIILGSVMTLALMNINFVKTLNSGTENAASYYDEMQARNMGNSMTNFLLSRVADSSTYRTDGYETKSFSMGSVNYRIVDTELIVGDTLVMIETEVNYQGCPKNITIFIYPSDHDGWVPTSVRGGWTVNADLNNTISDMYIDGRDHDLSLNIVPGTGTYGVSTSVDFINVENAAIGGTYDSTDYTLQYPENPAIIEEFYDWGGSFPESPDAILGYPEGTLKSIAQSGENGSQYLLNPSEKIEKDLTFPLSGVTYIELTDGQVRKLEIQGFFNGGILVVHGPNSSANLKGLKIDTGEKPNKVKDGDLTIFCHSPGTVDEITMSTSDADSLNDHLSHGDMLDDCPELNSSWFEGLIITDYSFHHHLDILGAIIQLSPDLETIKNCNGNKEHWVKYSREAIENATKFAGEQSGEIGNNSSYFSDIGFGQGRQKATYWFE